MSVCSLLSFQEFVYAFSKFPVYYKLFPIQAMFDLVLFLDLDFEPSRFDYAAEGLNYFVLVLLFNSPNARLSYCSSVLLHELPILTYIRVEVVFLPNQLIERPF